MKVKCVDKEIDPTRYNEKLWPGLTILNWN